MSEMMTITKERYEELWNAETMLNALEEAGVDNWEGHCEAIDIYNERLKVEQG